VQHSHSFDTRTVNAVEIRDESQAAYKTVVQALFTVFGQVLVFAYIALQGAFEHAPKTSPGRLVDPNHQVCARHPQIKTVDRIISVRDPRIASDSLSKARSKLFCSDFLPVGLPVEAIQMDYRYAELLPETLRQS